MSTADELTRGWSLHQSGKHAEAERIYRQVLALEPNNANAWCYLGIVCYDQERWDESLAAYRRAIKLQPQFPIAYNNLGNVLRQMRRIGESLAAFDESLRQNPSYLSPHKNRGTTLLWEGMIEQADASFRKARELKPDDPETRKNLGIIALLQGRLEEGWPDYEWRLQTMQMFDTLPPQARWKGESLDGRTILLVAEQGLGDTLQFIRYAGVLKQRYNCKVFAVVQKPLLPLLHTYKEVDRYFVQGEGCNGFELWTPLLSVPGIVCHKSPAEFPAPVPYLSADPALVEKWRDELAKWPGMKIGIAWSGNPTNQADRMRSLPLEELAPLSRLDGVQLFSLQKGPGVEQLETVAGRMNIVPLGDRLDNHGAFLDTAAVMKNLDLVISADTSVGHLAGALGVPVWLGLNLVADWRWQQNRADTPWYPKHRLFRQPRYCAWSDVVREMVAALLETYPSLRFKPPEAHRLATTGINRVASTRHGLMLYNRHDIYIGRSLDRYGEFSEEEVDLMRQFLRPGHLVIEVGANIGSHTVPLAKTVGATGRVIAFEPQRIVYQTLCANVAINSLTNVYCRCEAVGDRPGVVNIPTLDYSKDNNFGGLSLGGEYPGEPATVVTIDQLELPRCDLLKADVEGMELSVLQGARQTLDRFHPILYLENDRPDKSPQLIEYLLSIGYQLYWHCPRMFNPGNYFGNGRNEFEGVRSINMLGVHESLRLNIQGLRRVTSPQSKWND